MTNQIVGETMAEIVIAVTMAEVVATKAMTVAEMTNR
jgi:hypothetical protein